MPAWVFLARVVLRFKIRSTGETIDHYPMVSQPSQEMDEGLSYGLQLAVETIKLTREDENT